MRWTVLAGTGSLLLRKTSPSARAIHGIRVQDGSESVFAMGRRTHWARPLHQLLGDLPLRSVLHGVRDAGLAASIQVLGPALGQVQVAVEQRMKLRRHVPQMHRHHTIVRPSCHATVLALYSRSLRALLGEARLVDHSDPLRVPVLPLDPGPQTPTTCRARLWLGGIRTRWTTNEISGDSAISFLLDQ